VTRARAVRGVRVAATTIARDAHTDRDETTVEGGTVNPDERSDMDIESLARNWWVLALRGAAAIVFGILALLLPGASLAALILLFGSYALVDGIFSVVAAVRRRGGAQPWWVLLLEGLVSIAAGIVTFAMPGLTAIVLLYVIAAWAIVTGVLEVIAAVRLRKHISGEWWLAASGVLSVVFGVFVILAPGAGALALVMWIGAYAVVFGAMLVGLAYRVRSLRGAVRPEVRRAA
jgi:uncharacterized membrane protein HdeD (DUF308 family)